ncbi:RNA polymerase sigma factor [Ancylomarina sp. 16SWW S1-10-2]|uniref:RNA polymerase sigma factor n=1 Tax=Ancylomarina sp. 16SWW S1-10-2 TaxID=2499681 RepID=UPI0012AE1C46|nr:sigma-70 family RNA polymerase sigma factor [Ancylomarina sp. 16SWW S1-10-2]MRT93091.1 sigma-70 family RNA polymerase sigma factor [Ancylomarina sp. 16SWW S1-10-2]
MKSNKDSYYIQKIKNGDVGAYVYLVDRHKKMAFNIAMQIIGNREDAEEITQDAFLKAYQALDSYKGESKFSTWLYRIIYNASISKMRKKKLDQVSIDDNYNASVSIKSTQSALQSLTNKEQKLYINRALNKMNADEKTIINLFYLEENSVSELSDITGLSVANVKVKLHRSRKKLYGILEQFLQKELKTIL